MATFHTNDLILNGTYRIEKQIGQGAFGDVYLAVYLPLGIYRAIKVVRKGDGLGSTEFEQYRDRFRQEAKLGATFNNANIIHVDQFEEGDGELFLIMDYAPGGSLTDQIEQYREKKTAIPVEKAVQWVSEAADGLTRLHENDMVHRDVKPSNILLDANSHAYIADLGLVQLSTSRSMGSSFGRNHPGTPEYMPPEQKPGNYMPLLASADVYALGCVLFELLTGKQYYHRPEGTRVASLRPDVPAWLDDITARALAPEADDRFRDAGELAEAIKNKNKKIPAAPPFPPVNNGSGVEKVEEQARVKQPYATPKPAQYAPTPVNYAPPVSSQPAKSSRPLLIILGILGIAAVVVIVVTLISQNAAQAQANSVQNQSNLTLQMYLEGTQTAAAIIQENRASAVSGAVLPTDTPAAIIPTDVMPAAPQLPPPTEVIPTATSATTSFTCPGMPPSRVTVGSKAQVCTKVDHLVFREQPYLSSTDIYRVATGTIITIVGGPQCGENSTWWTATYGGVTGWIREGTDSNDLYFICPVQ